LKHYNFHEKLSKFSENYSLTAIFDNMGLNFKLIDHSFHDLNHNRTSAETNQQSGIIILPL